MSATKRDRITISVVTASYNCVAQLPKLIESLRAQTDKNFEWVVADGSSSDGTLEVLSSVSDLNLIFSSEPDFGIYDALNRAIRVSSSNYYIVAGADDYFYADAIANFKKAIAESGADVISASVMYGVRCVKVRGSPVWLSGAHAFIANHSLSSAFRKELHERYGAYSNKFPIAADALFVIRACQGDAICCQANFVAGKMGSDGISALDWAGSATEVFRVQLLVGCSVSMQVLLLVLRLIKGANSELNAFVRRFR